MLHGAIDRINVVDELESMVSTLCTGGEVWFRTAEVQYLHPKSSIRDKYHGRSSTFCGLAGTNLHSNDEQNTFQTGRACLTP